MTLSINWLRDQVASYFTSNAITTPVVYGTEKDWRNSDTSTRVVIGLKTGPGSFKMMPAGPAGAPGYQELSTGVSARPIATKRQFFWVAIRAVCPSNTAENDRILVSQALADDIRVHILRAIHQVAHGSHDLNIDGNGEWVDVDNAEFRHGAMIKLTGWLDIPDFDRPRTRVYLAKPDAPDVTKVHVGLDLEACDASHCEPVVSTP